MDVASDPTRHTLYSETSTHGTYSDTFRWGDERSEPNLINFNGAVESMDTFEEKLH